MAYSWLIAGTTATAAIKTGGWVVQMQRAADLGLGGIGRSRSAPAATLREYAASYAVSMLHQVRRGPCLGIGYRVNVIAAGFATPCRLLPLLI